MKALIMRLPVLKVSTSLSSIYILIRLATFTPLKLVRFVEVAGDLVEEEVMAMFLPMPVRWYRSISMEKNLRWLLPDFVRLTEWESVRTDN